MNEGKLGAPAFDRQGDADPRPSPDPRAAGRWLGDLVELAAGSPGARSAVGILVCAGRLAVASFSDGPVGDLEVLAGLATLVADLPPGTGVGCPSGLAASGLPFWSSRALTVNDWALARVPGGELACLILVAGDAPAGERRADRQASPLAALHRVLDDRLQAEAATALLHRELEERAAALQARADTEKLLIDYLLTATDGVWQTDAQHRFVSTTTDLSSLRLSQARVFGRTAWELAGSDPADPLWQPLIAAFDARRPFRGFEYSLPDDKGEVIWREVNGNPIFGPDGTFRGFRGTSRNVTDRKRAELALQETNSRLAALAQSGIAGIIVGQGELIEEANAEFLRIVGFSKDDVATGRVRFPLLTPPGAQQAARAIQRSFDEHGVLGPLEWEYQREDGRRAPVLVSYVLLDRRRGRWMGLVQDISERKQAEARIRELADRDTLTGLCNRRSFMEHFAGLLAEQPAGKVGGALILLDLDHFKDVNDTLGHDAGDALLCEVATRISRCVRQGDVVARLGGDEFAILLRAITDGDEIGAIARRILDHLRRPFRHDARLLYANASVGIVIFPNDGRDAKQLLKNADIALYRSKARGRRTLNFFDPCMLVEYEDRLALDTELQRALQAREFSLAFQPTLHLKDGSHAGFEALLRWQHPVRGLLSPASFVANLEQSGLIVAVGRLVLDKALRQLRSWLDLGIDPGHIAVNIASAQLRHGELVRDVERLLGACGLEARRLRVEITENVLLEDSPEIATTLEGLHALGVEIALDDFGTGFASLSHLKRVPVDVLKIDRSFVSDIGSDADDAAISRAIITLAHSLGMAVVAEGVASEEAVAFLKLNACDEAQGYLFGRPMPPEEALSYLRRATPVRSLPPAAELLDPPGESPPRAA